MKDINKTKIQLVEELRSLRQDVSKLKQLEWLLTYRTGSWIENSFIPGYGDLSALNTARLILDSIGPDMLKNIAADYINLLQTSGAIYELNGDYALGIFSSGWCKLLDKASRKLCGTDDNRLALSGGKWLCHESCWTKAAKISIEKGTAVDIECNGGLHLYAVPIRAGSRIVGSIDFGYGNPPRDSEKLTEIADKYCLPIDQLRDCADGYQPRPPFFLELAKERLQTSAHLIGEIIDRKQSEAKIDMLAKLPTENPNPILRVQQDGTILFTNKSGCVLLEAWNCSTGKKIPIFLSKIVSDIYKNNKSEELNAEAGDLTFSLFIVPIPDAGYLNIYGMDITEAKKKRDELERFNRLSVGRELKMIELKQKINELSAGNGISPPYKLDYLKIDSKDPIELFGSSEAAKE